MRGGSDARPDPLAGPGEGSGTLELLPRADRSSNIFDPYLSPFPALSLLTTDVGHLESGCPCGRSAPVIVLEGRGGVTRHKGCALAALDILSPEGVE